MSKKTVADMRGGNRGFIDRQDAQLHRPSAWVNPDAEVFDEKPEHGMELRHLDGRLRLATDWFGSWLEQPEPPETPDGRPWIEIPIEDVVMMFPDDPRLRASGASV